MAKLIDSDKLKKALRDDAEISGRVYARVKMHIEDAEEVDAVEVVHGRWVDRYGGKYANPMYGCSECNKSAPLMHDMDLLGNWKARQYFSNYCPNCGAKMDGDGNERC